MSHSFGDSLQVLRIAILLCFLPALLYRIWRLWRYPTSVPAVAATGFAVFVWLWLVAFTDWAWSAMPPVIRAISAGGWWIVALAGCLQVFVVGIRGDASAARIRRGLRITFVVTAIISAVVAVAASQSELLLTTRNLPAVIDALLDGADPASTGALVVSSGFAAVVFAQLSWVGMRHADRTPVGTGLGLLATASFFQLIATVCGGIWRPLVHGVGFMGSRYGLWIQTWPACVAALLMFIGFVWPPVVLNVQARSDVRRLQPLHDALGQLFPKLFPPEDQRVRLSDLVFEWRTHIQDGLTVLAQHRQTPMHTEVELPLSKADRAAQIADWLVGELVPGFSYEWLRSPDGVSDQDWVLAIADAYRGRQDGFAAPASLSGMPSTLRR
ncbi:hypothetical protein [Mycobacteroides franklinii]|uniref:hypothetical protein n=1 Tax=Mycobacteroides franklinii TaxID=948102 RepID=UPI0009F32382|nr:hypothetical protein [Mycobacteroides franklinii]